MRPRPYLTEVALTNWTTQDGTRIRGIGLHQGAWRLAILTPAEAYKTANRIVDLAEQLQQKEGTNE